jgi:Na+/proline symporter
VVVTDLLQFILAMVGAVALAIFAVRAVGGIDNLLAEVPRKVAESQALAGSRGQTLRVVPSISTLGDGLTGAFGIFLVYIGLFWWTDKTADQGGYLAQRLFACKSERHALGASLWFAIAHYALRPWPWIIAALATIVLFPAVTDHKAAYTMLIMQVMGPWWRGLLIASLLAAFISTINTQLNWGASYLMTDLYQRFLVRDGSPKNYVRVSRLLTALLLSGAGVAGYYISSIEQAWKFLALLGAGSGVVLLGRWLWWRVNAWSELAALGSALACSIVIALGDWQLNFARKLVAVVPIVTVCWLIATLLTRPTGRERLVEFARRIRPPGPGWRPIRAQAGLDGAGRGLGRVAVGWLAGVAFVFGLLLAIGKLLLVGPLAALPWAATAVIGGATFFIVVPREAKDHALVRRSN